MGEVHQCYSEFKWIPCWSHCVWSVTYCVYKVVITISMTQCLSVSLPSQKLPSRWSWNKSGWRIRCRTVEGRLNKILQFFWYKHVGVWLNLAINMQLTQMFLFLHLFARFLRKSWVDFKEFSVAQGTILLVWVWIQRAASLKFFFLYNSVWFGSTLSLSVTSVPMNKYFSLMHTCTVRLVNS